MKKILFTMYLNIQPDDSIQLPAGAYKELNDDQFKAIVSFPGLHFSGKITDPAWFAMRERMEKVGVSIHQL